MAPYSRLSLDGYLLIFIYKLDNHLPIPYIFASPHLLDQDGGGEGGDETFCKWHVEYGGWEERLRETRGNLRPLAYREGSLGNRPSRNTQPKQVKGKGRQRLLSSILPVRQRPGGYSNGVKRERLVKLIRRIHAGTPP